MAHRGRRNSKHLGRKLEAYATLFFARALQGVATDLAVKRGAFDPQNAGGSAFVPLVGDQR